ncbi:hypothetical protein JHK85_030109 [Glycine max]|nr:hypothetical protein JHK85_030109 [Glycine max]KAG5005445.1 hypothetical protein JHK86_029584 [Glycine max]
MDDDDEIIGIKSASFLTYGTMYHGHPWTGHVPSVDGDSDAFSTFLVRKRHLQKQGLGGASGARMNDETSKLLVS